MYNIQYLLDIMARLRDPQRGCPWDKQQNFATIAAYTIEEAYEVVDTIDRQDYAALCDELGDLLLQVVFHSRMAEEAGYFNFSGVVGAICAKMLRRHPHVFADAVVPDAAAQTIAWEEHKRQERESNNVQDSSLLADIPRGLPEWQRALKLQKRAATIGFDWPSIEPVLDKLHEEIAEVRIELEAAERDSARLADEIGDILFVCVNLARHAKVDFSQALRSANAKFERRFRRMETLAEVTGIPLPETPFASQDRYWEQAKQEDKAGLLDNAVAKLKKE